jgi:uncharacterized repeat protein (TIGR01451 family)
MVKPYHIIVSYERPTPWLIPGDTIHTSYSVLPTTGDIDNTNNMIMKKDTVISSFDPNDKQVTPNSLVTPGNKLTYTIRFENTGNGMAKSVYILDTLSTNVEPKSLQLENSSHSVSTTVYTIQSGANVIRFDYPDINLADSSKKPDNSGFVTFSIKSKSTLVVGDTISNRAGIYFDDNDVVMTNVVVNTIPDIQFPASVRNVIQNSEPIVYPNPTNDMLYVNLNGNTYTELNIVNNLGQVLIHKNIDGNITDVSTKQLIQGIYQLILKGDSGVKVMKVEKQ